MLLICMIAALSYNSTGSAEPTTKTEKIQYQLQRYYHADGFIKAIGNVAHRTIYNSNDTIRNRWKRTLRRLIHARVDAESRLAELRTPSLPRNPPHQSSLLCIHRYEGSWTDDGLPFFGGLQFDSSFQETYSRELSKHFKGYPNLYETKGSANHWTPLEQMWVAEMAIISRGFYPWPNTARYCGLL